MIGFFVFITAFSSFVRGEFDCEGQENHVLCQKALNSPFLTFCCQRIPMEKVSFIDRPLLEQKIYIPTSKSVTLVSIIYELRLENRLEYIYFSFKVDNFVARIEILSSFCSLLLKFKIKR